MAAQITDAAISAEHVSLEVLAPARGGGGSVVACPLKSAVFVLRSGAAPAALLLSPGRGGAEQPRPVRAGERATLRAGDLLLLARDPWRHAYRLEPPAEQPAEPRAREETQAEADTPRHQRQRKAAAPKRRPLGRLQPLPE